MGAGQAMLGTGGRRQARLGGAGRAGLAGFQGFRVPGGMAGRPAQGCFLLSVPLCSWTGLLCVTVDFIIIKIFSEGGMTLIFSQRQVGGASESQPQPGRLGAESPRPSLQRGEAGRGRVPRSRSGGGRGLLSSPGGGPLSGTHFQEELAPLAAGSVSTQTLQPGIAKQIDWGAGPSRFQCLDERGDEVLFITGALKIAVKWPTL